MTALRSANDLDAFFERLSVASRRTLLLDYDGTLAPFRIERDQAFPYPDVVEPICELLRADHTRVVIISGRAVADLMPLLRGVEPLPEIWGSHGWERRDVHGTLRPTDLPARLRSALDEAKQSAQAGEYAKYCEVKPVGIALHWRGLQPDAADELREKARRDWLPLVEASEAHAAGKASDDPPSTQPKLELHDFDGGIELRASGRNKGDAVSTILGEMDAGAVVAYLGDDRTDEDAFRALAGRGLSVLVGEQPRETLAEVWLKPPDELTAFLTRWSRSCTKTQ